MTSRKRFSILRVLVLLVCILVLLPLLWLAPRHIGPRSPGPTEDPIVALNAAGATISPNAADIYQQAFEQFCPPDFEGWKDETGRSSQPLPAELVAWIESQAETVELVRQAATIQQCWFTLQRDDTGATEVWTASKLRSLVRLLAIRARTAVQERDIERLAETVCMLNALARHAYQQTTVIDHLVGTATLSAAVDYALVPYAWAEIDQADRAHYAGAVAPLFEPPPAVTRALAFDRDDYCWMGRMQLVDTPAVLAPPERFFGELDRRLRLYFELAGLPVEEHIRRDNPLVAKIVAQENDSAISWSDIFIDPARAASRAGITSYLRVFQLRARLIAIQRGSDTVASLFRYRDDHGAFPASLEILGSASKSDPHTGHPFVYHVTTDGFTLYSVGLDRDDDGGTHDERFGEKPEGPHGERPAPDGDYVFWPLPE